MKKNWERPLRIEKTGQQWVENFWWQTLRSTWGKLATVMQTWIDDPNNVPKWLTLG